MIEPKVERQLTILESGDALFEGEGFYGRCLIGIERKRIHPGPKPSDLIQSIRGGHLTEQLRTMHGAYSFNYLIVEGNYRPGRDGILEVLDRKGWADLCWAKRPVYYSEVDNYLTSVELSFGVRVRRTCGVQETWRSIANLYQRFQVPWDRHRAHRQIHEPYVDLEPPSLLRKVARQLPGIGDLKSDLVERHFPSVKAMVLADEKEWMTIDGVGRKTASEIVRGVNGESQ